MKHNANAVGTHLLKHALNPCDEVPGTAVIRKDGLREGERPAESRRNTLCTAIEMKTGDLDFDRGMPPLKWSTQWDMIISFSGGPEDGWKVREA
jgi:hypothetical protein